MNQRNLSSLIPIWLLFLLFLTGGIHNDRPVGQSQQALAAPQYPDDREAWWKMLHGPPPTQAQLGRTHQVIERQLKVHDQGRYRDAGINDWDDLGPKNIGGRIRALAIDPNNPDEIYIGGVAGGVWRTTNSGQNWSEVTPSIFAYPVTSIAIDPTDTDMIYATTGEYRGSNHKPGVGVLKSTDGGNNWSVTNQPDTNFLWLGKIILNPLDPDILYVVGSTADSTQINAPPNTNTTGNPGNDQRAVFRSNDGGQNWTQLLGGGTNPGHIWDIEINPNDTSELIIGTRYQAMISDDSGASWNSFMGASPLITTPANFAGRRCEVAYCQSSPATIYVLRYLIGTGMNTGARRSELWQSTDGGTNWTLLTSTNGTNANNSILSGQGIYDNTLWVDPSNCSRAIMGGINIWKWSNSTLTRISDWVDDIDGNTATGNNNSVHADQHIIVPHPDYDGSNNSTVYFGNDGGIYVAPFVWIATQNTGWAALNTEINITQLYAVDVSVTGDTLVAGSQDNSYFVDRTGNGTDLHWGVYSTGDGAHCAIKKSNPEIIYASTQRGNYYKSADGGDTFCHMLSLNSSAFLTQCGSFLSIADGPLFIAPLEMDPNDDNRLYVAGQSLRKTDDEGTNWQIVRNPITGTPAISTIEIADGDQNTIWIGYTTGRVSLSTDGGSTWANVDNNGSGVANNYISDIAINPNNHDEVIVTAAGGFNQTNVYYTDDAGQTWSNRSPDFDLLVYSVTWHPSQSDWVYIGSPLGIFASEDDGQTWSVTPLYNQSDGPVYAPVVELVWQGDGSTEHPYFLVAATHGRGAWRTSFPIRSKYYVDKNCSPCGLGSFDEPYATFSEALEAAGNGAEIVFLSGGTYNEISSDELIEKRIKVTLDAASTPAIIE